MELSYYDLVSPSPYNLNGVGHIKAVTLAEIDGNSITLTCSDIDAISNTITLKIINSGMESQLEVSVRA